MPHAARRTPHVVLSTLLFCVVCVTDLIGPKLLYADIHA